MRKIGRLEESSPNGFALLEQKPDCAEAWCNLEIPWAIKETPWKRCAVTGPSILHQPDYPQARLNRALGLLRLEDFENGWLEYEWRWKLKECRDGISLSHGGMAVLLMVAPLLVHAEQGLGDTIQLSRYAKYLKEQGHRVVMECQGNCSIDDQKTKWQMKSLDLGRSYLSSTFICH